MMWDGLRKRSIYPVFRGDTGRKRNHLAKKSQQPKPEITYPTPKLPPWSPFEYTSKAALVSIARFPAQACKELNKGSEETTWVPRELVGSNF